MTSAATKTVSATEWEAAWADYMDALAALESARPDRFRRGGKRAHGKAVTACAAARGRLAKLDPEFCRRNDLL
jgi:hypothetical protein